MKIMFVCHGNICRSPMAEFVMKHLLSEAGIDGVEVESAALHTDEIGSDIHSGTRRILQRHGIPFSPRRAWLLTAGKAAECDMVVGMDDFNMEDLAALVRPEDRDRIYKLMEFADMSRDVEDPWYTGDFDATYRDVLAGCRGILRAISAQPRQDR